MTKWEKDYKTVYHDGAAAALQKSPTNYKAQAERLAEALKQIVELNANRGRGKPVARACNRMVDVASEALAQWEAAQ